MSLIAKQLWSGPLQTHEYDVVELTFKITGAKAVGFYTSRPSCTYGFDAAGSATAELGQTTINNLVGDNIITAATSFGSTAMGTDAFGFVLSLDGQFQSLSQAAVKVSLAGTITEEVVNTLAYSTTTMPNTLPSAGAHRIALTSTGDVAGLIVVTGLDAASSGFIKISLYGKLK